MSEVLSIQPDDKGNLSPEDRRDLTQRAQGSVQGKTVREMEEEDALLSEPTFEEQQQARLKRLQEILKNNTH